METLVKAHQIQLTPTKAQKTLLHKSFGVRRYSYNWALAKWIEMYENGEKASAYTLVKLQNKIKREEMPFFMEVSKTAPQYAIHAVEKAFKGFFRKTSKYPKFKKKGVKDSFVAVENSSTFGMKDNKIKIPRIGWIRCCEDLRFEGKVNNVVVKRIADKYFAVVNIEVPHETPMVSENQVTVGVDFGIKDMMILSDGTIYKNPKALKSNLKQLKRLQRSLSRKHKGGSNKYKAQMKVAKKHYKISCIRKNAIHQATTEIVKSYDRIIIEDLNVKGMVKNHNLAQALSEVSFGEIRRQLAYKSNWNGKELIVADRFFPSSKNCSSCGNKKEKLKLSERIYKCESCGFELDRDINAARNLANYSPTDKLSGSKAFGEGSSVFTLSPSLN